MAQSIFDIKNMGDALRNTGYKNIESAVSEIIDNSIEANAKNIFLILSEDTNPVSGRKVVCEIGFLDNGDGMSEEILGGCLGIGTSTRRARHGMGRFGVGLPQASLYAAPEVEVYSWQNGIENCKKVFLDINKVRQGLQKEIPDPIKEPLPDKYLSYVKYKTSESQCYDFSQSGTLVIWKACDRISPKTRVGLTERLDFSLGQKFRYFIHNKTCEIKIISHENQDAAVNVRPNDPLFLMDDNRVLCKESEPDQLSNPDDIGAEPVFEPFKSGCEVDDDNIIVDYLDKNGNPAKTTVKIRFSIVKPKFYDTSAFPTVNPGNAPFGKYAKKMEGISVIRANREIDFRKFNFYDNVNEPQHRWWGCEIIFDPVLDEAFGVTNNKQYVELKKIEESDVDWQEPVQPMWVQLSKVISETIKVMYNRNEKTRKNTRKGDGINTPTTSIVNEVEGREHEGDLSEAGEPREELSPEQIEEGKKDLSKIGIEGLTDEEAKKIFNNLVNFKYGDLGERQGVFDYSFIQSTSLITINISNDFYKSFLSKVFANDRDAQTSFELFLAAFVLSVRDTNIYQKVQNDNLVTLWSEKLRKYIAEQLHPTDK